MAVAALSISVRRKHGSVTPAVSVVICAYTEARWDDLLAAVASLQRQTAPPLEILAVIDHNARLYDAARLNLPGVRVLRNVERRGLSGARNTGAAECRGRLVAFLDDDAVAAPNWIERLTERHVGTPHVLAVGGAILPSWPGRAPRWFPEEFLWVVGCTYRGLPTTVAPVRNPIGANLSLRADVLKAIGGFRAELGRVGTYPVGGEETELCIRAQQAFPEGVVLYDPQARVSHRVSPERTRWRYFRRRCYSEGISKAIISRLVGTRNGLASERAYVRRTLPSGVLRGLADAVLRRDPYGLARAAAIVLGLGFTTMGYARGTLAGGVDRSAPSSGEPDARERGTGVLDARPAARGSGRGR